MPAAGTARKEVAAEVDQERVIRATGQAGRHPIDCVLLADAAKVDLHPCRQRQARAVPGHAFPAHAREQRLHGLGGREV